MVPKVSGSRRVHRIEIIMAAFTPRARDSKKRYRGDIANVETGEPGQ